MKLSNLIIITLFLFVSVNVNAAELVTLNTRPDVEQKFILIKPAAPVASVILFAGGSGTLNLSSSSGDPTINKKNNNFLVRTRELFASHDFLVAVVDAPSDHGSRKGMFGGFRNSMEHVEDIDHVIRYLREIADVPVWMVGTSRGTESVTNLAINSSQKPDGLILTASMSVPNAKGTPVTDMDLDRIMIPTLVVTHSKDGCWVTPPEGAKEIADGLINSKKLEVKIFSGGDMPISKPCKARSYHGFLGIDDEVVSFIAGFIKSN
ncbi:MAG: alpha/beta hydrolase [Sulfuriflexus sp.]|nr:alpha/beta hydrolase [Sulfuriflexus sp.]